MDLERRAEAAEEVGDLETALHLWRELVRKDRDPRENGLSGTQRKKHGATTKEWLKVSGIILWNEIKTSLGEPPLPTCPFQKG